MFDGNGKFTITAGVNSFAGNIVPNPPKGITGTYTLDANCTGTIVVKGGPTFDIFVAPDGEMFSSIATDPGNYPSRIELRAASE